jgi:hypothetical protein
MKIHPVFHISLLEPYKKKDSDRPARTELKPVIVNDSKEWEVEKVLNSRWTKRRRGAKLKYKVY